MKLNRQSICIPLKNFDNYISGSGVKVTSRHGVLLPSSVRSIVCGPSGVGKTNSVFLLLLDPNGLRFENVYVFSKSLYQPKYQFLAQVMPKEIGYYTFDDNNQVIQPSEAKPNSVMIFDDISCEKQNNIRQYFAMGRHNNIDVFYIGQTYSLIPKQIIRDCTNFLILFKQDDLNLRHIYSDHVNTDMTFEKFKDICSLAWKDKHGFIVIAKEFDVDKGRYRVNFDTFVNI